ncbi:kinase-like domain-containing protein [Aspergillus lucknowensis]|uniref:Kinase-like domain-containing protein n=1 Tax=Aspergillus lucknowensis TaxID=176173 RepID=A0ABR4L5P7_9EURO
MVQYRLGDRTISLELPDATKKELDFTDSSFFTCPGRQLPTPMQVRALSKDIGQIPRPKPIKFEELNLIVKFGRHVTTLEALNLWMVRKVFKDEVPVPEVFGWRTDDEGYVFIYIELIQGPTLLDHWSSLDVTGKRAFSDQLSKIVQSLRRLEQDPFEPFISSINKHHLQDYIFTTQPKMGPFASVKEFNDQFALLHQLPFPTRYDDPYRAYLPDEVGIKFTHADLHRGNIIVSFSSDASSSSGSARLVLVDWQQAGWYPEYWEYCKALYTCSYEDEWRSEGYIDTVLRPWEDVFLVFSQYCMAMGSV